MSNPLVTVAICTWNRSASLDRTLAALTHLEARQSIFWELIVVDNNCTDDTAAVLARFAEALPLRVVRESEQGHSHARNRAVREARGRYILWTDDDVVVSKVWLGAYVRAFAAWPDHAVFGGPIVPQFDGTPPAWLPRVLHDARFADVYAARDLGPEAISLDAARGHLPYGANFAVRAAEQRENFYNPALGLKKKGSVRGEETDVIARILSAGGRGRWVPKAPVRHVVPRPLQTEAHFRHYFMGQGRAMARLDSEAPRRLLGHPRWVWGALGRAVAAEGRYAPTRALAPPHIWAAHLRQAAIHWGRVAEYWDGIRREASRSDAPMLDRAR